MNDATALSAACINCGLCTKKCTFLRKYAIDLQGFALRPDLAYHCFLCGDCTAICPKDIDGAEIALAMRRERVQTAGGKLTEKGYSALVAEKKNYLFRGEKKGRSKSLLYPGCNFPSFFPKTTDALMGLLQEKADIGVLFDCCGKPIADLGLTDDADRIIRRLEQMLTADGIEELIVLCPNCYAFLTPRLSIPVVSIYEKLQQLGLCEPLPEQKRYFFVPCPDKTDHKMQQSFEPFLRGEWENIQGVSCCGLGGCASGKEPELAEGFQRALNEKHLPNIYTYCASCAGCIRRGGVENVHHLLVELLGTGESSVLGPQSVWHRAKRKFR